MGINSNVKKSDVLSTKEINELAVKFFRLQSIAA